MDWEAYAVEQTARYEDGKARLSPAGESRQKQLVRMAMAAGAVGLARLMQGRPREAAEWLISSAERYRESFEGAPPGSWGRPVGAVKARLLAGDGGGAVDDARWALALGAAEDASPIGRYAGALAQLVLEADEEAAVTAVSLQAEAPDAFPEAVAKSLGALAIHDSTAYDEAVRAVLRSFEERDAYLEDARIADTVLVLQALAAPRRMEAPLSSPLLPPTAR